MRFIKVILPNKDRLLYYFIFNINILKNFVFFASLFLQFASTFIFMGLS